MPYLQPEQSDSGPADAPQAAPLGATPAPLKRIRKRHFERAKRDGIKITALTSYDMLTASIFDAAGVDLLLVGDSAANNVLGYSSTVAVTVDELLPLARAVAGAAKRAFVVADLPFGSYELSDEQALATSFRFMKEAGVHAVKLEGGVARAERIRHIVSAGIPVMGHIGFTPQSEHQLGGHLVQGRGEAADAVLADALAVQDAGAFAVVLELMPAELARRISGQLDIPTIGIGAGPGTDGQILVWTDFAGLNTGRYPAFVKKYAELAEVLGAAAREYVADVTAGSYPGPEHSYE